MAQAFQSKVIELLLALDLNTTASRAALLVQSGLDRELINSINYDAISMSDFVPSLVSRMIEYGELEDGRDALSAVLNVAKTRVGVERRPVYDALIEDWRTERLAAGDGKAHDVAKPQGADYKFDVFLSCGQKSMFDSWIELVFYHRFEGYLREYLLSPVRIFRTEALPGQEVPLYTKTALAHSRCLVAMCYPTYFQSHRLRYEMAVILQRERRLGYCTEDNPTSLVLPVYLFDGVRFPDIVAKRDSRCDCNGLTSISIERSEKGVVLEEKIVRFAAEVANTIVNTPAWNDSFYHDLSPDRVIEDGLQAPFHFESPPRW